MKTAVDTSVLLDVLAADRWHGEASREALRGAYDRGALVACEVVLSELRACFASDGEFDAAMASLGVRFEGLSERSATLAGRLWREQRAGAATASKPSRPRLLLDFLIGAHALLQADALLARDRGFYKAHFKSLRLIDPSAAGRT